MGGNVSKEESQSNLKKENLTLPDIAIEFPLPTSGNEGPSDVLYDIQTRNINSTSYLVSKNLLSNGLQGFSGLLAVGVPLMKLLLDQTLHKMKTLVTKEQRNLVVPPIMLLLNPMFHTMMNKRNFAEEKVTGLQDLMDLYYDYLRRYGNDQPKMIEETKGFQRKFGEQLKRVKNAMTAGHISSPAFKIWVNGAAFHVEMLIRLAQLTSEEDSHSVRQVILIYQADLQQIIECYRKFREASIDTSSGLLEDREQNKTISNVSLDRYEVTQYLFEVDKQIPEIQEYFNRRLNRVDYLVKPDSINSTARVNEVVDEMVNTSGSGSGNRENNHEDVTLGEHGDHGPARDHLHGRPYGENFTKYSYSPVNLLGSSISANPQLLVEAVKIQSLLLKFTETQFRSDFLLLQGLFNIPVSASKLLQEIDQLNSRLFPFVGKNSDTGSQMAVITLIALVEKKPEPLNLGAFMAVRTYKSWAQILKNIVYSDYWDTSNGSFADNHNTPQETGRSYRTQDSYPSAASPQYQEQCSFSYPQYNQNQHSESENGISNSHFFNHRQRGNHKSSPPCDFSQSGQNSKPVGGKHRKNDSSRGDLCMFCGETGHEVEECPLNVKCLACSEWGHLSESCPENRIVFECPICRKDHLGKDCPRFSVKLSF